MNSNSHLTSLSYQNEIKSVMKAVTCFVYMLSLERLYLCSELPWLEDQYSESGAGGGYTIMRITFFVCETQSFTWALNMFSFEGWLVRQSGNSARLLLWVWVFILGGGGGGSCTVDLIGGSTVYEVPFDLEVFLTGPEWFLGPFKEPWGR